MPLQEQVASEFQVREVVIGAMTKHPNADSLSVVDCDGYPVVVRTADWRVGDRAAYVPVDGLVPTSRPEFTFLKKEGRDRHRVRAARLRGVFSQGLLVPLPAGGVGELDVQRWLSPEELRERGLEAGRSQVAARRVARVWMPVYSLDAFRKYRDVLREGEPVCITEKIHGTNARYLYKGGKLWVGTHRTIRGSTRHRVMELLERLWLRVIRKHRADLVRDAGDAWWEVAERCGLKEKLRAHPGKVLFGEIYGKGVQKGFPYDHPMDLGFRVFDVFDIRAGRYLDVSECRAFAESVSLEGVPVLYCGPWSAELVRHAEGQSVLANHMREGCVVKPLQERSDPRCGRVALKLVGEQYLLQKE